MNAVSTVDNRPVREVDVLVVGAGPAGLAAATALATAGAGRIEVLDREREAGGTPRHSHHQGYGIRDLHRVLSGPAYARRLTELAVAAGATVRTGATATGWAGPRTLDVTAPTGLERIRARAVLLATGARERPRSARLVPGGRPAGVYTTGQLQQAVHLHRQPVGTRAVVVGAEHVSFSAVLTLRRAGTAVAALLTELPRHQTYRAVRAAAALRYRVPVLTGTAVTAVLGTGPSLATPGTDWQTGGRRGSAGSAGRVTGVAVRGPDGADRVLPCDTVVFTGDWIPDHELARRGGLAIDPGTRGPAVDTALATSEPGVFAAGNLLHPVRAADAVALEGRSVARSILRHLAGEPAGEPRPGAVPLRVAAPLRWIAPQLVGPSAAAPPGGRFVLWSAEFVRRPRLVLRQGGRALWSTRYRRTIVPNRPVPLPADWMSTVDAEAGPVTVELR